MLDRVCKTIGVESWVFTQANKQIDYYSVIPRKNQDILKVKSRVKVKPEDVKYLQEFYKDEIQRLKDIGINL